MEFYKDIILTVLIVIIVPLCSIAILRIFGKTKRRRTPIRNFRYMGSVEAHPSGSRHRQ
jgi:hypothetical protein